jgi:hypothetical protein
LTDQEKKVLRYCSKKWFGNPAGIFALDLNRDFHLTNEEAMALFERMVDKGLGTINANVVLYQITFSVGKRSEMPTEKVVTHIFFPSKDVLAQHFYKSTLSRKDIPEYSKRLHLGAPQIGMVFFKEEVLRKYFDHPEKYKINDTLSGGYLTTNYKNENEDEYLHVRYGKKLVNNGRVAVIAIYKDLVMMSLSEQRYWSSYEIKEFQADPDDENFRRFLLRTYEGEFVNYLNPISDLSNVIDLVNKLFGKEPLFQKNENIHLHRPVENTKKAYCDSCSELFKLVGPDNIKKRALKEFLFKKFGVTANELMDKVTGRELSSFQLLQLLESKVTKNKDLTERIEKIKKHRIEADHKILDGGREEGNYTTQFNLLCEETVHFLKDLAVKLERMENSGC